MRRSFLLPLLLATTACAGEGANFLDESGSIELEPGEPRSVEVSLEIPARVVGKVERLDRGRLLDRIEQADIWGDFRIDDQEVKILAEVAEGETTVGDLRDGLLVDELCDTNGGCRIDLVFTLELQAFEARHVDWELELGLDQGLFPNDEDIGLR